ncbi:MAG: peptidylprolyl isomerase [Desulfobulbaceae bacterium]|nr:peptidylprolyl isomerase [Desulfobulbaceae bacterium]
MKLLKIRFAFLLLALTVLSLGTPCSGATSEKNAEEVAASVNGAPIIAKDLEAEVNGIKQQLAMRGQTPSEEELAAIRENALQKLIQFELLVQASGKAGIEVAADEVENQLSQFKQRVGDEENFAKMIADQGMTEIDVKRQLQKNMSIQQYIKLHIMPQAVVDDKEAKDFYTENKKEFEEPDQVKARHILLMVKAEDSKADKEIKREKLLKIKKQIAEGADFAKMAQRFSEGPSAPKGGDLGFFTRGQMVKPFEKVAFSLMPGDVSDLVETDFGYHLIKVEEKKYGKIVSFEETKEKIKEFLAQQKVNELVENQLAQLHEKAEIKITGK